jgi:hypothetical protein
MKYGSVEYQYAEPIAQGLIEDSAFRRWVLSKSKFSNSSDARILHEEMKVYRRNPTAEWWRFYFTEGCRCLGCSGNQRLLEQAIDDLPEIFRIVLVARVIEEMSVKETADLFGLREEPSRPGYIARAAC